MNHPSSSLIPSCHPKLASFSGVTTGCRRFTTRKTKCQLRRANRLCCNVLTMNIRCGSTLQKRVTGSNLFQCIFVDVSRTRQIIHLYSAVVRYSYIYSRSPLINFLQPKKNKKMYRLSKFYAFKRVNAPKT